MDIVAEFEKKHIKKPFLKIRPGDTVRVHQKIKELVISEKKKKPEEKERIQVFEGVVIKRKGGNRISGTFTVRNTLFGVGVEKTFPIYSPTIAKIELVKRGKVRRAKLYYLRERAEKEARLKEKKLSKEIKEKLSYESEELKAKSEKEKAKKKAEKPEEKQIKKEVGDKPKKEEKPEKEKLQPEAKEEKGNAVKQKSQSEKKEKENPVEK